MTAFDDPGNCALCDSAGSVYAGFCQVCLANVDGAPVRRVSVHSGLGPAEVIPERQLEPVRFSEVMDEIKAIALLAAADAAGHRVSAARRRAEALLERLRNQFIDDVILGTGQPSPVA